MLNVKFIDAQSREPVTKVTISQGATVPDLVRALETKLRDVNLALPSVDPHFNLPAKLRLLKPHAEDSGARAPWDITFFDQPLTTIGVKDGCVLLVEGYLSSKAKDSPSSDKDSGGVPPSSSNKQSYVGNQVLSNNSISSRMGLSCNITPFTTPQMGSRPVDTFASLRLLNTPMPSSMYLPPSANHGANNAILDGDETHTSELEALHRRINASFARLSEVLVSSMKSLADDDEPKSRHSISEEESIEWASFVEPALSVVRTLLDPHYLEVMKPSKEIPTEYHHHIDIVNASVGNPTTEIRLLVENSLMPFHFPNAAVKPGDVCAIEFSLSLSSPDAMGDCCRFGFVPSSDPKLSPSFTGPSNPFFDSGYAFDLRLLQHESLPIVMTAHTVSFAKSASAYRVIDAPRLGEIPQKHSADAKRIYTLVMDLRKCKDFKQKGQLRVYWSDDKGSLDSIKCRSNGNIAVKRDTYIPWGNLFGKANSLPSNFVRNIYFNEVVPKRYLDMIV